MITPIRSILAEWVVKTEPEWQWFHQMHFTTLATSYNTQTKKNTNNSFIITKTLSVTMVTFNLSHSWPHLTSVEGKCKSLCYVKMAMFMTISHKINMIFREIFTMFYWHIFKDTLTDLKELTKKNSFHNFFMYFPKFYNIF